jgi:hypothetical protein
MQGGDRRGEVREKKREEKRRDEKQSKGFCDIEWHGNEQHEET